MKKTILALLVLFLLANGAQAKDETSTDGDEVHLSGKVKDEHNRPVAKAQVILHDQDSQLGVDTTDKTGGYDISHRPVTRCAIQVVPAPTTGLAQAIMTQLRGDESRHMMIIVKRGFTVQGRVLVKGQPLKGVLVRAVPGEEDAIHNGGEVLTDKQGRFRMTVTPGEKVFEVHNRIWKHATGVHSQKYVVTADGAMPDIIVPSLMQAGAP